MPMTRRTWGEGARIVNDRDCCRRVSRAARITPIVDALRSSTLRQVDDDCSVVEGDSALQCAAQSPVCCDVVLTPEPDDGGTCLEPRPQGGGPSVTVKKEDPARAMAFS